ncbi:UPF0183 protein, partial [Mucuna pruriens]
MKNSMKLWANYKRFLNFRAREDTNPTTHRISSIKCFKCLGKGQKASQCRNRRVMIVKDDGIVESESSIREVSTSSKVECVSDDSHYEGDLLVVRILMNSQIGEEAKTQRENIFYSSWYTDFNISFMYFFQHVYKKKKLPNTLPTIMLCRVCEGTVMGTIPLNLHPNLKIRLFSLKMPIYKIEQQPNIYNVVHVKLRLIEIFDVKQLQMSYSTSLVGGESTLTTFVADRGIYTLFYLCLSFAFSIPSQFTNYCHDEGVVLPLEFPNRATLITCRVSIYDSSFGKKVNVGP